MLNKISKLGFTLSKQEQKTINGGDMPMTCIQRICEAAGGKCVGEKCVQ